MKHISGQILPHKTHLLDGFRSKTCFSGRIPLKNTCFWPESDQKSPEGKPKDKAIIVLISILPFALLISVPGGNNWRHEIIIVIPDI